MTVEQLKTTLYTLLQPIFGGTVIWGDQNAPRPALPYVTLRLGVVTPVGEPHYSSVDNAGIQTVQAVRESVLNVQRFGNASVSAVEVFTDKLTLNSNLDKFFKQKISVFDVSPVTDVAQLMNGISIEPRASVDVSIRWTADLTDNVGVIETVVSSGGVGPVGTGLNEIYAVNVNSHI